MVPEKFEQEWQAIPSYIRESAEQVIKAFSPMVMDEFNWFAVNNTINVQMFFGDLMVRVSTDYRKGD